MISIESIVPPVSQPASQPASQPECMQHTEPFRPTSVAEHSNRVCIPQWHYHTASPLLMPTTTTTRKQENVAEITIKMIVLLREDTLQSYTIHLKHTNIHTHILYILHYTPTWSAILTEQHFSVEDLCEQNTESRNTNANLALKVSQLLAGCLKGNLSKPP